MEQSLDKPRNSLSSRPRSRANSKSRSKNNSRSSSRTKSRPGSKTKSRSGSRKKSRSKSAGSRKKKSKKKKSKSKGRRNRSADKSKANSKKNSVVDAEGILGNDNADSSVRILREGESLLISRYISELEITLFRPLPEEGNVPLFFDTTACLFSEYGGQTDYVGVGRKTTNNKGILHKPHAVLKIESDFETSKNFLEPAGGNPVVAGDGILVNFKKIAMRSGLSVCATLFTTNLSINDTNDVYYAIKDSKSTIPFAIIPLKLGYPTHNSCIALMIRKVKSNNEATWELVRIGETLEEQDVRGVVTGLQRRGLIDPVGYNLSVSYELDQNADGCSDNSGFYDEEDEEEEEEEEKEDEEEEKDKNDLEQEKKEEEKEHIKEFFINEQSKTFETLLARVPRVTREGRRQYNVGRSTLNAVLEAGDSSDEDEVMEDALRAVVPRYTSACPVRYEDKTYNVGSRGEALATHYIDHREEYGLSNPEILSGGSTGLPPIPSFSLSSLHRLSLGTTGIPRPGAPQELLPINHFANRLKSTFGRKFGRSPSTGRGISSRGSRRSSSRGRRGRSRRSSSKRKSHSRSASAKRKKGKKGGRKGSRASRRRKSRKSSAKKNNSRSVSPSQS